MSATWKGSFRGIPFHLEKSSFTGGRRAVFFEYPGRDTPDSEDMGRRRGQFQLELFVIGVDYAAARLQLLAALETAGPGLLVHPWWGSFTVQVGKVGITETVDAQGQAGFSVEFSVTPGTSQVGTTVTVDPVTAPAQGLDDAAAPAFAAAWSVKGPIALVGLAEAGLQTAMDTVQGIQGRFDALNQVTAQLRLMGQQITSLVLSPTTLGLQLVSAVHTITETAFDPLAAFKVQLQLLREVARPRGSDASATAVRRQADANDGAVSVLLRISAYADACRLVAGTVDRAMATDATGPLPGVAFETRAQARDARDALLEQADLLLLDAPDALFLPLVDLTASLITAVDQLTLTASLDTVTLDVSLPAAVVAFRYAGTAAGVEDLITRNNLRHPLFVPAGEGIEVLHG